jgi:hypothetical protein
MLRREESDTQITLYSICVEILRHERSGNEVKIPVGGVPRGNRSFTSPLHLILIKSLYVPCDCEGSPPAAVER